MKRRKFIESTIKGLGSIPLLAMPAKSLLFPREALAKEKIVSELSDFKARYYEKLKDKRIKCILCPRECIVADLERGYCGVRENRSGIYYSLVYSKPCSLAVDPIEKKPLFHFKPGSLSFSLATAGCNIECKFCQNWNISQMRPEQIRSVDLSPSKVVKAALKEKAKSIAFTYTEPVVFQEYMIDTAKEGNKKGIPIVMISNGYIKKEPLSEICKHLPAIKVDLKAFTEKFYKESCSGELKPVLDSLIQIKKSGIWLELVVLIIPGLNDSKAEIDKMTKWVKKNLGKDVPMHFTRFHPMYKMKNIPSTPLKTLERCREVAKANGINFPYIGNVPGHEGEHTYCPKCSEILIKRYGFYIMKNSIKKGKCPNCKERIPGIWL